jgi:hypothetical protein
MPDTPQGSQRPRVSRLLVAPSKHDLEDGVELRQSRVTPHQEAASDQGVDP